MSDRISRLNAPAQSDAMREFVLAAARDGRSSPARAAGRRLRKWALAGGGGVLLVAAALFLVFRPTPAQAALGRVIAAAEAVKTCHLEWHLSPPGSPEVKRVLWYDEGKFRTEEWQNGELDSIQVFKQGKMDTYLASKNQLLRATSDRPFATEFEGFGVAALIKAEGDDAKVECESVHGRGRRELNRFTITQGEMERTVVLADPATDLPVSIEFYGPAGAGWEKYGESDVIEYDVPADPSLFVLMPPEGATIVDRDALKAEWQQRLEAGMARAEDGDQEAVLRDFQVTTEGDVFAIWTAAFPSIIRSAILRDSLGTTYLQDSRYFHTGSWPCAWFIPVRPLGSQPAWYLLRVTNGHHSFTFRVDKPVFSGSPDPVYPGFKVEQGGPACLSPWGVYGEIERAEIRAAYWKSQGDAQKALEHFARQVALSDEKVHRFYVPAGAWLEFGGLYEQTGQRQKAHNAYERGLESHDHDPNRNDPDQQEVAEKLEQGLKRTR